MFLVGCSEGKTPLERPRRRWNSNSDLDIKGVCWEGVSWINLAHDTDKWWAVNTVFI
jgi:hypothetical protein